MKIDGCKISGIGRKTVKPQYFVVYQILSTVEYRFQPVLIFGKNRVRILASVVPYSKTLEIEEYHQYLLIPFCFSMAFEYPVRLRWGE